MAKSMKNDTASLLRLVEERASSKKAEEEQKKQQENPVPYLPKDCISNILIRLPVESLQSSRFVSKPWYTIINSPIFIDAHLHRSESVLIFLTPIPKEKSYHCSMTSTQQPNNFLVEGSFLQPESIPIFGQPIINSSPKFCIQFMDFKDGKSKIGEYNVSCLGNIRATCNGLILLDNKLKKGGLVVINPIAKKLIALPPGTLYPPHDESYGFALSEVTGEYKVVHLFRDELGYINCETLNLGTRCWREVNGPSFGLFTWFGYEPVSAIRALHWVPQVDRSDYLVSMEVDNEKFHTVPLPRSCRTYDRIVEMGGFLSFVTHEELIIDIWTLEGLGGEVWTKQHSITMGCIIDLVPLFSLRISGDMVFMRDEDGSFYAYDFKHQVMRKVEMEKKRFLFSNSYIPHVNSLVSWKRSQDVCD